MWLFSLPSRNVDMLSPRSLCSSYRRCRTCLLALLCSTSVWKGTLPASGSISCHSHCLTLSKFMKSRRRLVWIPETQLAFLSSAFASLNWWLALASDSSGSQLCFTSWLMHGFLNLSYPYFHGRLSPGWASGWWSLVLVFTWHCPCLLVFNFLTVLKWFCPFHHVFHQRRETGTLLEWQTCFACIVPILFFFIFIFWSQWEILVPQARTEPTPPVVEVQSLNDWTAREAPCSLLFWTESRGKDKAGGPNLLNYTACSQAS